MNEFYEQITHFDASITNDHNIADTLPTGCSVYKCVYKHILLYAYIIATFRYLVYNIITTVFRYLLIQVVDQTRRAHIYVTQHGLELCGRESRTQLGPNCFPLFTPQVHQVIEQLVVHERHLARVPVDERSEVLYHDSVYQLGVTDHQQRLASLVDAEIPLPVKSVIQRIDGVDERYAAHHHVTQAAEQRRRRGVRYAEPDPLSIVVRQVHVTQERDE